MAERVLLLVGTKKGAFIVESGPDRKSWTVRGPTCEGYPIQDINVDPASGVLYAGGGSEWYGPTVFRSEDRGQTWTQSSEGLTYGDDGPKISAVWSVTPPMACSTRASGRPASSAARTTVGRGSTSRG